MDNKDLNKQDNVSIKSPYVNGARDDAHSADDQKRSSDSESDNSTVEYFSSGKNNKPSSNKPADADSSSGSDDSIVSDDTSDLDDSVVAEENAAAMIKKLREKLKKAESEKQEYLTGWQRDKAEFINARKRDQEDKQSFIKFANENLVSELIPVMESFDMAMGNKEAWETVDKNWRIGVEYI